MKKVIFTLALTFFVTSITFSQTPEKPLKVAIFIYEGAEMLDFVGPTEVFGNAVGFEVFTVAISKDIVSPFPQKMLKITPNYSIDDCPKPDILVLPGGTTTSLMLENQKLIDWIKEVDKTSTLTMSVCTGAALLSKAGILDNKKATTHWGAISNLQQLTPKAEILKDTRFVYDGKLLTTAGVSAGIDGALFAVKKLKGEAEAHRVATIMEYDYWKPDMGLVVGEGNKAYSESKKIQQKIKKMPTKMGVLKKKIADKQVVSQVLKEDGKDPICGMPIPKGAKDVSVYKGKQVGFCSVVCKEMFDKNPAKFTVH
jgi:transcriptional regulator GlxA family with amidase domain/YHS domain-containing protein